MTVGCGGVPGSFDYASLGQALGALQGQSGAHEITVSGTCQEVVLIERFGDLRISGQPGAAVVLPPAPPQNGFAISINDSSLVHLQDLTIRGEIATANGGVAISRSRVILDRCTVENSFGGIVAFTHADLQVRDSIVQDNEFSGGVRVDQSSTAIIGRGGSGTTILRRNSFGLRVEGDVSLGGSVLIEENAIHGVSAFGRGYVDTCCGESALVIRNNGSTGIRMDPGTSLRLRVPALIEGHPQAGIYLRGAAAQVFEEVPDIVIRGNGSADRPSTSGGIVAWGGSHLDLFDAQVVDNAASGVVVRDNSSARLQSVEVSANGGNGLLLDVNSTASLFPGTVIQENLQQDLLCALDSYATGDPTGIEKSSCKLRKETF